MQQPFGWTGAPVAIVGQGTWKIGAGSEVVAAIRRGLDLGMTHVDTAELYTGAEDMLGEALAGRRDEVFLVSKVMPRNASRAGTVAACERSLKRLRTDRLDAYLLHWLDRSVNLAEAMAGMRDLVAAGKVRHVGVSNFGVRGLVAAQQALGDVRLATNQVLYHLGDRLIERDVVPWCEANGVAVVGYTPFGNGFYDEESKPWRVLQQVGARHGRTPRQVALAFLTRRPSLFAIPKASTVAHVEENAGGQGFELTARDLAEIDEAFPL